MFLRQLLMIAASSFFLGLSAADGALNTVGFNSAGSATPPFGGGTTAGIWYVPNTGSYTGNSQALTVVRQGIKILVGGSLRISNIPTAVVVRLHADGTIDSSFGSSGIALINTAFFSNALTIVGASSNQNSVMSLAVDANNNIIAGCQLVITSGSVLRFAVVRLLANGIRDTTFNTGSNPAYGGRVPGIWYITGTATFTTDSSCSSVALQPDGKIVMAGYGGVFLGTQNVLIGRLTETGQLDVEAFNSKGTIPGLWYKQDATLTTQLAYFNADTACLGTKAIAIQSTGRILVGCRLHSMVPNRLRAGIVALTSMGVLDTDFNISSSSSMGGTVPGYFVLLTTSGDFSTGLINGLALDADQNILATGSTRFSNTRPFVMRLTFDGALDTSFGKQEDPYGATSGFWIVTKKTDFSGSDGVGTTIAVDAAHRILVTFTGVASGQKIVVARLTSAGVLDDSFHARCSGDPWGGDVPGFWYFSTNNTGVFDGKTHVAGDMIVLGNGQIILACYPSVSKDVQVFTCVSLINKTGILQDTVSPFNTAVSGFIYTTTIDQSGKLIAGGQYGANAHLTRYTVASAVRDATFSADGVATGDLATTATIHKVINAASNGYLVAASSNNKFTTAFYLHNGSLNTAYNSTGIVQESVSPAVGEAFDLLLNGTALAVAGVTDNKSPSVINYHSSTGARDSSIGNNGYQQFPELGLSVLYAIQNNPGKGLFGAGARLP